MEVEHLTTLELKVLREISWRLSRVAETSFVRDLSRPDYKALVRELALNTADQEIPHLDMARIDAGAPIPLNTLVAAGGGFRLLNCENCIFIIEHDASPAQGFYVKSKYCALMGKPGSSHDSNDRIVKADGICEKFEFSFARYFEKDIYMESVSSLQFYMEKLEARHSDLIDSGWANAAELELAEFLNAIYDAKNDEEFLKGVDEKLVNSLSDQTITWEKRRDAANENEKLAKYDAEVLAAAMKALADKDDDL